MIEHYDRNTLVKHSRHWNHLDMLDYMEREMSSIECGLSHVIGGFECRDYIASREINKLKTVSFIEHEDSYELNVYIPGSKKEDIELKIVGRYIEIFVKSENESENRDISYRISIPYEYADLDSITATMDGYTLVITIPKKQDVHERRIVVQ